MDELCPDTVMELTFAAVTQNGGPVVSITMRVREKDDRGVVQSVVLFLGVSVLSELTVHPVSDVREVLELALEPAQVTAHQYAA